MRILLLTFVLLTACTSTPAGAPVVQNSPEEDATVRGAGAQNTPGLTRTPAYTVTPDFAATERAAIATHDASDAQIARDNLAAKVSEAEREHTESTRAAENRAASLQIEAMQGTQISIQATGTKDGQEFAARVPTIVAAMTAVQYNAAHEVADIAFPLCIGFGIFPLGLALLITVWRLVPAAPAEDVDENELDEQPAVVQTNTHSGSYLAAMQYEFSAPAAQLAEFWQRVAVGRSISYGNFTPKEKGFSRDEFNMLQNELVEFGLARPMNINEPARGLHLTEAGRQYAQKCKTKQPPAPDGFVPLAGH